MDTDRHDEAYSSFSHFANVPKKIHLLLLQTETYIDGIADSKLSYDQEVTLRYDRTKDDADTGDQTTKG